MQDEITVKVFPEIENRVVELSHTLERLMVDNAPEAWSLVLATIQIEYLTRASWGILWLVLLVVVCSSFKPLWRRAVNQSDPGFVKFIVVAISSIISAFSIFGLMYCFGPWTWVGLFKPELIIAYRVLNGIM